MAAMFENLGLAHEQHRFLGAEVPLAGFGLDSWQCPRVDGVRRDDPVGAGQVILDEGRNKKKRMHKIK